MNVNYCPNIYYMCVYLYIHIQYTQNTHIYHLKKRVHIKISI